jgi:hypothetical protein
LRVFKVKVFARFQRKERVGDEALCRAVLDIEAGLIDADLGGGLVKQRIARKAEGKRGGYRTIIAYRARGRAVFLFGFAKNTKANLDPDEHAELARRGQLWLAADDDVIAEAVGDERLVEIDCDTQD